MTTPTPSPLDDDSLVLIDKTSSVASGFDPDKLKSLGDALRKAVLGQDKVIKAIAKNLTGKSQANKEMPAPIILYGPPGVGKSEMIKRMAEEMSSGPAANGIITFDIGSTGNSKDLLEKFNALIDGSSRRAIGEQAAQACHDGVSQNIVPMKPLQIKRGFYAVM